MTLVYFINNLKVVKAASPTLPQWEQKFISDAAGRLWLWQLGDCGCGSHSKAAILRLSRTELGKNNIIYLNLQPLLLEKILIVINNKLNKLVLRLCSAQVIWFNLVKLLLIFLLFYLFLLFLDLESPKILQIFGHLTNRYFFHVFFSFR